MHTFVDVVVLNFGPTRETKLGRPTNSKKKKEKKKYVYWTGIL